MVKTIQEWFSSLDWSKQLYLNNIYGGLIKGYNKDGKESHYSSEITEYRLNINCLSPHNEDNYFRNYDRANKSWGDEVAVQVLYASRLKTVNMISDSEYMSIMRKGIDKFGFHEIQSFITETDFKYICKLGAVYGNYKKLLPCVMASDDPDNPDWSLLVSEQEDNNMFDYRWFEFIPFNEALKLVRKDLTIITHLMQFIRNERHSDEELVQKQNHLKQVRELIFCENGISAKDREKIIVHLYSDRSIHDFIWEILPIDIRYGKLISEIYKRKRYSDKAIIQEMNSIIEQRKHDNGTTEERKQENWYSSEESNQYRYSKKVRQMAMIFRACVTKSYPKSKASVIGDALCLLKMYDFNWNQIFDAVYGHADC